MSLSDFWECSLWEFAAAVHGWNLAQSGEPEPLTGEEYDRMLEKKGYR